MSFLTAEWRKLAFANYEIDPAILKPHVPYGTELDLWQGRCFCSLIGFMFLNTKLLGFKIPFHVNFEEVNLRFYVKRIEGDQIKRGVVFIKEIVPKPALTFVANTIYKEHYVTHPMRHSWEERHQSRVVEYAWKNKQTWQRFKVEAALEASPIEEGSFTEFITEHYWGYAKIARHKSNEYEVTHPKWEQYLVNNYAVNVDFGVVYGTPFAFLTNSDPVSVLLAEGSAITVEGKKLLKA